MLKIIRGAVLGLMSMAASSAYAQSDFRPGYVLPLSGDTVRGQVDYRGSGRSSRICQFRPAAEAPTVKYLPTEIRGYGFPGGRSYDARLMAMADSAGQARPARRVFLEVMVAGPGTLYRYRDAASTDHFFFALESMPTSSPVPELVRLRELVQRGGSRVYNTQNLYQGKLGELTAACPAVQATVGTLAFTLSALTDFVQRYNACIAPGAARVSKPAATAASRPRLDLLLGAEVSQLNFNGEIFLAGGKFRSSPRPVVGLGFHLPTPTLNEKLSIRLELLLEQQLYEDSFTQSAGLSANYYRVKMDLVYLRVPLLVRYTFPKGRCQPFLQAGVSYARSLRLVNEVQAGELDRNGAVVYSLVQEFPKQMVGNLYHYEYGLLGSVGLNLPPLAGHPFSLELRYEHSSGLVNAVGFDDNNQRISALVGYSLTK